MENLAHRLAAEAQRLDLARAEAPHPEPVALAEFATGVLEELAALGCLPDPAPEPGCWARPRHPAN